MLVNWKCEVCFTEVSGRREYPERKKFLFFCHKMLLHTRISLLALLCQLAEKTKKWSARNYFIITEGKKSQIKPV